MSIHGIPCTLQRARDGWTVLRTDTGAKVAQAPQRFLALARAAVVLHTPARRSA